MRLRTKFRTNVLGVEYKFRFTPITHSDLTKRSFLIVGFHKPILNEILGYAAY